MYRGFCRSNDGKEVIWYNNEQVNGSWIYWDKFGTCRNLEGSIVAYYGEVDMRELEIYVIPETISEEVRGYSDKEGKKVFENDVVVKPTNNNIKLKVVYDNDWKCWILRPINPDAFFCITLKDLSSEIKVVGRVQIYEKKE